MKKKIKRAHGLHEKESLWTRGYFFSTIGLDEKIIQCYVTHPHHHNQIGQPSLFSKLISDQPQTPGVAGKSFTRLGWTKTTSPEAGNWVLPQHHFF